MARAIALPGKGSTTELEPTPDVRYIEGAMGTAPRTDLEGCDRLDKAADYRACSPRTTP